MPCSCTVWLASWKSRLCGSLVLFVIHILPMCAFFFFKSQTHLGPSPEAGTSASRHSSLLSWTAVSHLFFHPAPVYMIAGFDVFILKYLTCSFFPGGKVLQLTHNRKRKIQHQDVLDTIVRASMARGWLQLCRLLFLSAGQGKAGRT